MLKIIRQAGRGASIIRDWLGANGECVNVDVAESRAAICATCPHNIKNGWLARMKQDVASMVKHRLALKRRLGLQVFCEDKLGFCDKCGCVNSLKVWCPIEQIKSHTPESELEDYPDFCWVRSESKYK